MGEGIRRERVRDEGTEQEEEGKRKSKRMRRGKQPLLYYQAYLTVSR